MNFDNNVKAIEKKIGYTFKDKGLLRQAFTRTSYCNEHKDCRDEKFQSNEVLEFFGDSILSAAIVTLLMKDKAERYEHGIRTTLDEGDFSNVKSKLSDKKNLSEAMYGLGISRHLLMGEGDEKLGIDKEPSVMEDLFESIIGAIYIDSNYNITEVVRVVARLLDVQEYLKSNTPPIQSFKNALQEWCADKKHRRETPVYKTLSETGPDHKKIYERAVLIGDRIYGVGIGKNQKIADTAAAEEALKALIAEENARISAEIAETTAAAVQKLRELAAKEKKASPEFRDLGESARSTPVSREYEIECRFMGYSAVGRASDKRSAKADAAAQVLNLVGGEASEKAKKNAPKKTKAAQGISRKAAPVSKKTSKNAPKKVLLSKKNDAQKSDSQKTADTKKKKAFKIKK